MKKFYMILAALLIGSVCFAQTVDLKLRKMNVPASGAERSAWVGSTAMDGPATLDQGLEYAISPKAFNASLSGNITKVKFYHAYEPEVEEGETPLTNTSYTIKIYTNISLGGTYASQGIYELTATTAYTQNFTAGTETGWQEVTLNTPFAVPSGDFWVAIKANNGAAALPVGGAATAVEGQTYCQYDFTSQGASVLWVKPEFGSQGSSTLYNVALAVYVDDGVVYVPSSDFEARFFGGLSNNQLTPAEASYTLNSDESLTLYPFYANYGADDAVDGTVTFALTVNGVAIINNPVELDGTEEGTIPVGGWYNLLPEPYSYTITAQEMIDAGLSGTINVCFTISYTGNDSDLSNNSHCIPVTIITCDPITTLPYVEDFESGVNGCWTFIDADGDGNNWMHSADRFDITEWTSHSGTGAIVSESYRNGTAITPDNWAITPAISLPSGSPAILSFFAAVQDNAYSAEHYGVYVSTTTTDPSAFTLIWEETMDANGGNHSKAQGAWREKHADLSNYAGRTIYIGFRHFNCSDNFLLLIDDISINIVNRYTINAISSNNSMGTVTGGGTYNEGTTITLRATPYEGFRFVAWNDGNTSNPRTITVTGNATYIANFEAVPQYTITVNPSNSNYGYTWGGGTYTEGTTITIGAEPYEGCRFVGWSDGYTNSTRTITVTGNATFVANFEEIHQYVIIVNPSNPNYGYTWGGGTYTEGTTITIGAEPYEGYRFVGWNDGYTNSTRTITVTGNATFVANFEEIIQYTITVISSNPNYGYACCGGTYTGGTEITIEASPYPGYRFVGWNGGSTENPRRITVTEDATYTAYFEEIVEYAITVVPSNPDYGYACCSGIYAAGTEITIEAVAYPGYEFVGWGGGNTENPRTITVTGDATYTAFFREIEAYTIVVNAVESYMGTVSGGGVYGVGSEVMIEAIPYNGYVFTRWDDGNVNNPRRIIVNGDATYTAIFADISTVITHTITVYSSNPNYGSVAGGGTYAEGTRVLISASANNGYMFTQWSDGNTDNPRWITVIADATYIATFVRGDAVDETSISDISLYPNPASDILNITSSEEISEIEIVNVMGQVVFRMEVNGDNAVCDVNGLANGTYIVRIHTANAGTISHRKFVKE